MSSGLGFDSGFDEGFGPAPRPLSRKSSGGMFMNPNLDLTRVRVTQVTMFDGTDYSGDEPYTVSSGPFSARLYRDLVLKMYAESSSYDGNATRNCWLEYANPGYLLDEDLGDDHIPNPTSTWTKIDSSELSSSSVARLEVSESELLNDRHWLRLVLEVETAQSVDASFQVFAEVWANVDAFVESNPIGFVESDIPYNESDIAVSDLARNDL